MSADDKSKRGAVCGRGIDGIALALLLVRMGIAVSGATDVATRDSPLSGRTRAAASPEVEIVMGVIVPVVLIGAASAGAVSKGFHGPHLDRAALAWRLVAGISGAAVAALLAIALQGHQGLSVALVTAVAAGAGFGLATLEVLGPRGGATFVALVALAGVGGAAMILGLSSVALSATMLR